MNVGIIGYGNVGKALAISLEKKHTLILWDKYKETKNTLKDMDKCDVIFLCVPTPILKSGGINKEALYYSVDKLIENGVKNKIIAIKSTAVSGTSDELAKKYKDFEFAYCPEFLREKTAIEDMINSDRIIIGAESNNVYEIIKNIFLESGFSEDKCRYVFVNRKTAETIKYASNVFLATKVVFANELYNICKSLDVDYEEVVDAICLDKRIDRSYGWKVPGEDGKFSFSGRCFPKDLSSFIYISKENGYIPYFLMEVWRSNLDFRGEADWLEISGVYTKDLD